ncbi:MAG: polymorphic toxin-type HINT domain-containing protein, partial [Chloroflexota bacterium]
DLVGNRTAEETGIRAQNDAFDTVTRTFAYNAANQLETVTSTADTVEQRLDYDDNGNLTTLGTYADSAATTPTAEATYAWDAEDRLVSYADATTAATYTYTGDSDRLSQTVNTETMEYLLDTASGLTQVLGEFSTEDTYYLIGADIIGGETGTDWTYHQSDGLGSLRMLTDSTGASTYTAHYDPYGVPLDMSGTRDTSFGYTGEQTDSTGLQYLRARYYDPSIGIFIAKDPVWGFMGRSMSMNGYSYVHGNPINMTDPTGEYAQAILGGLAATAALSIMFVATTAFFADIFVGQGFGGFENLRNLDPDCVDWDSAYDAALAAALGALMQNIETLLTLTSGVGLGPSSYLLDLVGQLLFGEPITPRMTEMNIDAVHGALQEMLGEERYNQLVGNSYYQYGYYGSMATELGESAFLLARNAPQLWRASRQIFSRAFDEAVETGSRISDSLFDDAMDYARCMRNSFSADTDVSTPGGDVPIAEIEVGDTVYAYDELTGEVGEYEVIATINHVDEDIIHLYLDGELIKTTAEHPFYTDDGVWVDAANLTAGEQILSLDGDYGEVERVVVVEDANQPMYNLTVDEAHTFYVGEGD